jgi:hypothetical protein
MQPWHASACGAATPATPPWISNSASLCGCLACSGVPSPQQGPAPKPDKAGKAARSWKHRSFVAQEIAGSPGQGGRQGASAAGAPRQEYGWELGDCAQHLAGLLEGLLSREHSRAQQGQQGQHGEQEGAPEVQAQAGGGTGPPAPGGEAQQAQQGDPEAQRRERARLKRERMMAKMKVTAHRHHSLCLLRATCINFVWVGPTQSVSVESVMG